MPAPKGNKYAVGNNGGRPRKVEVEDLPEFGEKMVNWFQSRLDFLKQNFGKKGFYVDVPFFRTFGKEVAQISYRTLIDYRDQNEVFSRAWDECKEIQKEYIIFCGQNNISNSTFSIFTAKNLTDMTDRTELTGADGQPLQINIVRYAGDVNN